MLKNVVTIHSESNPEFGTLLVDSTGLVVILQFDDSTTLSGIDRRGNPARSAPEGIVARIHRSALCAVGLVFTIGNRLTTGAKSKVSSDINAPETAAVHLDGQNRNHRQ